jgi:hypothetical protein
MRIVIIVLLLILGVGSKNLKAQWFTIYHDTTFPVTEAIVDAKMLDEMNGYLLKITGNPISSRIFKTTDGWQSWTIYDFPGHLFQSIDFPSIDTGYVGWVSSIFFRTFDGGQSWNQIPTSSFQPVILNTKSIAFYDNNIGVASQNGLHYLTYDAGDTWQLVDTFPSINRGDFSFVKDQIYFASDKKNITLSFDTMKTFINRQVFNGQSARVAYSNGKLAIAGQGVLGHQYGYPHFNFGMVAIGELYSPDFRIYHFPQGTYVWQIVRTENNIYAQTSKIVSPNIPSNGYIIKSENDGYQWYLQMTDNVNGTTNEFDDSGVRKIQCLNDSVCFAFSNFRIYKTTNGGGPLGEEVGYFYENFTAIDEVVKVNKSDFYLFPNPATQSITIKTNIMQTTTLIIYDVMGKEVKRQQINAKESTVDVSALSNGVYFVRVNEEVRKLIKGE